MSVERSNTAVLDRLEEPTTRAEYKSAWEFTGDMQQHLKRFPVMTAIQEQVIFRLPFSAPATILYKNSQFLRQIRPADAEKFEYVLALAETIKDVIVMCNLRLVMKAAVSVSTKTRIDKMDLLQDGVFGLCRAIERFDPDRGYKFSTYATWWINQSIGRAVMQQYDPVRFPVHIHEALNRMYKIIKNALTHSIDPPTHEELACLLAAEGCSQATIKTVLDIKNFKMRNTLSLDQTVNSEFDDSTLGHLLPSDLTVEGVILEEQLKTAVENRITQILSEANISPRNIDVMCRRLGINGYQPDKLGNIGRAVGLTRERVRQIEEKLLPLLKKDPSLNELLDRKPDPPEVPNRRKEEKILLVDNAGIQKL